jgi:uncharacterized protein YjbK
MEVEVKLRLGSASDYDRLAALLAPNAGPEYRQENFFFDGANGELNARRVVLRVRLYNGAEKATLTVKGEQILKDGIARAAETEAPLDPAVARALVSDPRPTLVGSSPNSDAAAILDALVTQYSLTSLKCLGGFDNLRREFAWSGFTLELDRTEYPWGVLHELECETVRAALLFVGSGGSGGGGVVAQGSMGRGGRGRAKGVEHKPHP